jgi:hypothetical protein
MVDPLVTSMTSWLAGAIVLVELHAEVRVTVLAQPWFWLVDRSEACPITGQAG